ncbi:MAG: DUF3667 domain-containing protein [Telluria sp.]
MKTEALAHAHPTHCLNCDTAVNANFCPHCGQDTAAHMPSAGEFLHEFVGHYVALENKLLKTLALLLFKPGRLTREYLAGKRVRYVLPLRLYLTLSVIFFAMVKWETHHFDDQLAKPNVTVQQQKVDEKNLDQAKADLAQAGKDAGAAGGAAISAGEKVIDKVKQKAAQAKQKRAEGGEHVGFVDLDEHDRAWIAQHVSPGIADKVARFNKLSSEEQWREAEAALFEFAPYAIFAMMPVFALYLKLLYLGSGRLYGEHLLFALHTNAFAFLVLILMMLVPSFIPYVHGALWLWLTFYLPTAMRKVYGGSRMATWVRWMVLMILHVLGMVVAVVGALAMAVVA